MRTATLLLLVLAACGGPALGNVPAPDKAIAAGLAAGVAGAATLADDASGKPTPEKKKPETNKKPVKVKERVSAGALDRLDEKQAAEAAGTAEPEPAPTETASDAELDALDFRLPPKP